ncbi:MAG: adenylate/guanylate cyclase domain-containing protein [Turneriella sp.]|nr:adenylate/guanylate cyclase domain-containing protein [Turneriella sp.]
MQQKIRKEIGFLHSMRTGQLDPTIQEVLGREEENGARALLYFRFFFFIFFATGGSISASDIKDVISNMFFAGAYGIAVFAQWLLIRKKLHRAVHRFNYFLVLADHALFAGLMIFYYVHYSPGNFNHAMKSPYIVLLLIPSLTTLIQFRQSLLLFSLAVCVLTILGFFGYAKLSGAPQTSNWIQYSLGDAVIMPAWLTLWILMPLIVATLVGYAIFRSIRMVAEIGRSEGQKKQLARYFSPAVVEEISSAQGSIESFEKGERRPVAVLFADIRSFTTLSENMPPDRVAAMLSELRQLQMKAVFNNNGMVDKFIGDAIMAVFGAPRSSGSFGGDVANAVRAGLEMHAALAVFNAARKATGETEIRIGIGIHAGEAFAGNLGGEGQLEYTVIGDVVNTASRIEHLCKKAQADFLISETVAGELEASFKHEKIGLVKIRGREKPMGIHRVIHG